MDIELYGGKIPMVHIRNELAKKHTQYFRIFDDEVINNMKKCDTVKELKRINEYKEFEETGFQNFKIFRIRASYIF